MNATTGRWPPVYDAEDLRRLIAELAAGDLSDQRPFYDGLALQNGLAACQGDVLRLPANVPVLNAEGRTVAIAAPSEHWLILSNSCDLTRDPGDVKWMQIVPLTFLPEAGPTDEELNALRKYRQYRRFYLPKWPGGHPEAGAFADLTCVASAHRGVLSTAGAVVARLSRVSWVLLNACLVRFLARDDGRADP